MNLIINIVDRMNIGRANTEKSGSKGNKINYVGDTIK